MLNLPILRLTPLAGVLLLCACSADAVDLTDRHASGASAHGKADGEAMPIRRHGEWIVASSASGSDAPFELVIRASVSEGIVRAGAHVSLNDGDFDVHEAEIQADGTVDLRLTTTSAEFESVQYALFAEDADGRVSWDNNDGADYRIESVSRGGVRAVATPASPAPVGEPIEVTLFFGAHTRSGSLTAGVRFSADGWQTQQEVSAVPMSCDGCGALASTVMFAFGASIPAAEPDTTVEIAPYVSQRGTTYWATSPGENLVVRTGPLTE